IIANFLAPGKFDQLLRLAGVKITRHPIRLFPSYAELIKLITSALENEEPMTQLFELGQELLLNFECIWRKQPILLTEQASLGKGSPNCFEAVFGNGDHFPNKRSTSSAQRPIEDSLWRTLNCPILV